MMPENSYSIPEISMYFTFKFDLCNEIKLENKDDFNNFNAKLKDIYPETETDDLTTKYFNRSYLSIREPSFVLNPNQPTQKILIKYGERKFSPKFNQIIRLYPGQGIISIILIYKFENITTSELIDFYNYFSIEKEIGYTSYIMENRSIIKKWLYKYIEKEAMKREINKNNFKSQLNLDENLYGLVTNLRKINFLQKKGGATYLFESFRILLITNDKNFKSCLFQKQNLQCSINSFYLDLFSLLTGNEITLLPDEVLKENIVNSVMYYQKNLILTGDWASIFLIENNEKLDEFQRFESVGLFLFDYAHTLWFICQKWIHILRWESDEIGRLFCEIEEFQKEKHTRYEYEQFIKMINQKEIDLFQTITHIHHSLVEARDVDLMFYNSEYRKIMQKFYDSLKISSHIYMVESNLNLLEKRLERLKFELIQRLDFEREKYNFYNVNNTLFISILMAGVSGFVLIDVFDNLSFNGIIISGWIKIFSGVLISLFLVIIALCSGELMKMINKKY